MASKVWSLGADVRFGIDDKGVRRVTCDSEEVDEEGMPLRQVVTTWTEGAISVDLYHSVFICAMEWLAENVKPDA